MMDMLPVLEHPENEQYEIHSRIEIIALLRELIAHHTLVTIYFGDSEHFILTTMLAVNAEFEEIVLDASADPRDTEALLQSTDITVVGLLEHVKVQFHASHAERCHYDRDGGGDAIRIRLPETMLRLQRRNFYRIETPVARPLELVVPPGKGRPTPIALRVVDLSCGGIGVVYQAPINLELNMVLANSRLELPEAGIIASSVEVRFLQEANGPGGAPRVRCGMQFLKLLPASVTLLQRYINKLQRERRMR